MSRLDELEAVAPLERTATAPLERPATVPDRVGSEWSELVIRPQSGWIGIDWRELVRGRELLYFLAWRDVKVRYKQTVLGVAWALLQPLLTMVLFTIVFSRIAGIKPPNGLPYPVFVFAGLLPWMFFANAVTQAGQSLVTQQQILTKIYFPRLFIPTATVGVFLVDLLVSTVLYAGIMLLYRVPPSWQIVLVPPLLALLLAATLGLSFLLAALTVFYRDFRYTVPFLVQVLMYVSPVIYPADLLIHSRFVYVLALNPMFGIIDGFRAAVLGTSWHPAALAISAGSAVGLLIFGLFIFRRTERWFADIA